MRAPDDLAFTVHVAGEPGPDHLQRCVPCGLVLIDNTGWWEGRVAVMAGDEDRGPSWYPAGVLVGTDKVEGVPGGMIYARPEGRPLDANERACT